MLNKLSITFRMLTFIIIPTIFFIIVSFTALISIDKYPEVLETSEKNFEKVIIADDIIFNINKNFTELLSNINTGFIFWKAGEERTTKGISIIRKDFSKFNKNLSPEEKNKPEIKLLLSQQKRLIDSYKDISTLFKKEETEGNKKALDKYVLKKMFPFANAIKVNIHKIRTEKYEITENMMKSAINESKETSQNVLMYVLGGIFATIIIGIMILFSITKPIKKLSNVVHRLSEGEYDARVDISGSDEFHKLGSAFNSLLDERSITLNQTESDHQELNQSIFKLLQAVAELSDRNLTIRAEVTEDATGPVADAINLLAEETGSILGQVRNVAEEVNETSKKVNAHLMSVNKLAMKEQEQATETADQMDKMLQRLDEIANSAADTNIMADNTTISTQKAHESVTGTLSGMSEIRETVQETGKRIKQLGERSQEISHVIEIINTIAERTTVLALNASMQAAAAGDAGRGFSVIAEEIQRLAESSRDSTGQIATLVRNIQQETNTTIATMDQTIEQVIEGSTRAEDAAKQMKEVLKTTTQLVDSVDMIATASREQVDISESLKHKAQSILVSTQSTGQELLSLTGLSRNMADYAQQLVQSVSVFKIDTNEKQNID